MGFEGRRRRLLSLLLVGLVVIARTKAQSNPATVSQSPTFSKVPSATPSISKTPSIRPSISDSPSLSTSPSLSSSPSLRPSTSSSPSSSEEPSSVPSKVPTISTGPTTSEAPSLSETPSLSQAPSVSSQPSDLSNVPSISKSPSKMPSGSFSPSSSGVLPTSSLGPSTSIQPTTEGLRPIVEWKMLVANRFARAFSDVVEIGFGTTDKTDDVAEEEDDSDTNSDDTIVITATNTTSYRVGEQTNQPVLAMTGQAIIELDEWVDVSNYEKVQMLFWFYARRSQANVESDRFVVEHVNRTVANGDSTSWIRLKTYQRGKGRFRRNNQWYLGRVVISTLEVEAVRFRFQTFFPESTKMILLDKFGILGYADETTTGIPDVGDEDIVSQQQRGVPNRSSDVIRGKSTNITFDDGWLRQPLI